MSNVLSRHRSLSELEFWKNATEIRAEFTRYLMNEKKIPKRWRPVFTFSGIEYARRLMEEITAANTIYPTTVAELEERRKHQTAAIIICEQINQHLAWMIDTLQLKVTDFESFCEKLYKEIALLKAWRKQNKVLPQKKE